jgi:hypothetical protein
MLLFNCMLCEGKSKSRGCARYQPCFQLHFVIPSLEEGTWTAWLYDVLKPHVREIVVCNPRRNALLKEGSKSDEVMRESWPNCYAPACCARSTTEKMGCRRCESWHVVI